jgi:superfamily II DNA or RNA helicase
MSVRIKLDEVTEEHKKIIRNALVMQPKQAGFFMKNRFSTAKDPILMWYIDKPKNEIVLPYTFGNSLFKKHINSSLQYPQATYNFINTELRPHQIPIVTEAMKHLTTLGTTTLGAPPGAGKTLMSAWLASKLGGLVLVVSPLKLVQRGWETTFKEYTDAKIWVNDGKQPCPKECNVILTMDTMFIKIPKVILSMIKVLVIDEAHMFCTPNRIHCLLDTTPRYVIACTATPKRADSMQTIMQSVCGTHGIFIKPTKKYTVYQLLTGINVEIEQTKSGTANWPKLVKDLAENEDRK